MQINRKEMKNNVRRKKIVFVRNNSTFEFASCLQKDKIGE